MAAERKPIRVLAIDDDADHRCSLAVVLADVASFEVTFHGAVDFADGLGVLASSEFDLVFLDGDGGSDVGSAASRTGMLRELGHDLPIIVLSANQSEADVVEAVHAGAADCLLKVQVNPESLNRSMANALEKHRMKRSVDQHRRELFQINRDLAQEIQTFYQSVALELRLPLSESKEFVSVVLDRVAGELNDEQASYLQIAKDGLEQMKVYVDDLLDVGRFEAGRIEMEIQTGNIVDLVKRLVRCAQGESVRRQITLTARVVETLPPVPMDESRMAQVLNHLINNALKFTPEGGEIRVTAELSMRQPGRLLLSVRDTGQGIEAEHLERIFDRLYRVETSVPFRRRRPRGLGLGLNICREIVRRHDGEIWAESTKGEGSTFFVLLPFEVPVPVATS